MNVLLAILLHPNLPPAPHTNRVEPDERKEDHRRSSEGASYAVRQEGCVVVGIHFGEACKLMGGGDD